MTVSPAANTYEQLTEAFDAAGVVRPMRIDRYEAGAELTYAVTGVAPATEATVRLVIDKFVGGGFAGQVYRVIVKAVEGGPIAGLNAGDKYAMKILIPPSGGSIRFRNLIYWIGFQAPFSLQVNPDAARSGALWQKFIRRAASIEFGAERAVVDIMATFVDERMGSCGELSEWLEGRNWIFEVDDNLAERKKWRVGEPIEQEGLGAPEYRAKKDFMARIVKLFHQVGAPELGRQYEWWTCKSQPNCLKRLDSEGDPAAGLTAVDFRAGLALLCCLPMSPGDIKLIGDGLFKRGSLVQFDRGDVDTLQAYVDAHADTFADMGDALAELKRTEGAYRNSMIDVTHNHVRLLTSGKLWGSIFDAAVTSWRVRSIADDACCERLGRSRIRTALFAMAGLCIAMASLLKVAGVLGLIGAGIAAMFSRQGEPATAWATLAAGGLVGGIVLGVLARLIRAVWGRADLRSHYGRMLTSPAYFQCAAKARIAENLITWTRHGRVSQERALRVKTSILFYAANLPLAVLPAGLHRFFSDAKFAAAKLHFIVTRPFKLYFNADVREQWMLEMLDDGLAHGMVNADEAETIRGQLSEPFIQKYLKSLAVHVCTLPVTQIVSVAVAIFYWDGALSPKQNLVRAVAILAAFQVTPISPGSIVRGLYVVAMVIKDRNYKDYKIAVWMGFWKYIGYLSFPIQMAYHYPAIARFMAGRFSTEAVHILPVFGEHGALAEHAVFDLFYNRPLTIRRQMTLRAEQRKSLKPRRWHMPLIALTAWIVVAQMPAWIAALGGRPLAQPIVGGWMMALAAVLGGLWTCRLAGGASTGSRITMGALCGLLIAAFTITASVLWPIAGVASLSESIAIALVPAFLATLLGLLAALSTELSATETN